ncbi:gem-associated protein 4 [Clinocottus analis]|uniref:gem-associated protein 4 n=1 Tax=Clinocottus analis TaxID=304258 RepID=UPI0035BFA3B8
MTLKMNKDSAVLQAAFLRADQLCLPSSLNSLQKADWTRVGRPVLEAVREVCGREEELSGAAGAAAAWLKKVVCAVWLKVLSGETGGEDDVDAAWRENPFFPFQNGLPEVNRVVLLELVKSTAAARPFARLLSSLPPSHVCAELEKLARHARSEPAGEDDVRLFLEVWWELWKGGDEQSAGGGEDDATEAMFARQFARLAAEPAGPSPRGAKRPKLEASDPPPPTADVLHVLLRALGDLKDLVSTAELGLRALAVSLAALYTTFLADGAAALPAAEKLRVLSRVVGIREATGERLSPELLREALGDLRASRAPSRFRADGATELADAAEVVAGLARAWQSRGLLKAGAGTEPPPPSRAAFELEQSVRRVLAALREAAAPEAATLPAVLESLTFPRATEDDPDANMRVAAAVIEHRLEDYRGFALLFAGERSWAARGDALWTDCLERNRAAFQQLDALIELTGTLASKLGGGGGGGESGTDVDQCRKLMKVAADIFSALSLRDKNAALAAVLRMSTRGFFGRSSGVPAAVNSAFERELNMAFNCIIQGTAAASTQGNLNTAVSLVARVAFQNPEAALRSCCHSAVFNKGAFALMAQILQQLPGLRGRREEARDGDEEEGEEKEKDALLCECLLEAMGSKPLSANEQEQLLQYLGLLMTPVTVVEGEEERRRSFVTPQEVVNVFVLPNLSTRGRRSVDVELSLRLLLAALSVEAQDAAGPHWVLGCSPFPLLYVLAQLHNQTLRCWEQRPEDGAPRWSMDAKELLVSALAVLSRVVGAEVAAEPSRWSRALFWLYDKTAALDWTVRFHLKAVWGEHFKNEVPSSLLTVCDLPEQDWVGSDLPPYGQGTGLLAWMECCAASDSLRSTMLSRLALDRRRPDHVGMFSKGLLVALAQTLPGCSAPQWTRLLGTLRELIGSGRLYVPFSLEYVDFLPLLDLRGFSVELRLSVLLLRVLQLLCGSSCSHWLSEDGWAHVGRLYAQAVREVVGSVRAKLLLPLPSGTPCPEVAGGGDPSVAAPKMSKDVRQAGGSKELNEEEDEEEKTVPCQEVLFVLSQLFCHVQHIQVMMPGGQSEPLFLSSLEILSHYEAVMAAFPDSSSALESDNTRHFFSTITDNLQSADMKAVLQQKIAQLVSSAA